MNAPLPAVQVDYFPLKGGLDLVTQALAVPPGRCLDAQNYEIDSINGGYRRINGFERFDGRAAPSESTYWTLRFSGGSNEPAIRATIYGLSSGASGVLLEIVLESGTWAGGDAAGYFVLGGVSGTFDPSESIYTSTPEAFSSGFSIGFR